MWKSFSIFVLSQPFVILLTFLNLSLRRICVLCRFLGVWYLFARVSLTTCQFALYNCTIVVCRVYNLSVFQTVLFCALCQYLFILCMNAPWLEVHFSNWRSNLNLCINSFLGFERLCYGCEIRELCLFVFLLFVLVVIIVFVLMNCLLVCFCVVIKNVVVQLY